MSKHHMDQPKGTPSGKEAPDGQDSGKWFKEDDFSSGSNEEAAEQNQESEERTSDGQQLQNELKEKHLRLLAEFDNYKKRTTRERLELMSSASKDVVMALLPILDDFERAKKSSENPETGEQFSEGVNLVYNRLNATLQGKGLKAMESTGKQFDPEWHEAITEIPAPTEELKGKVLDTIEKGYLLNDKIIRHAKVIVGK